MIKLIELIVIWMRVVSCGLCVVSCELWVAGFGVRDTRCGLRVASCGLCVVSCGLRGTHYSCKLIAQS